MISQTVEEWRAEGRKRFGDDQDNWAFICPACGHVSTVREIVEAGGEVVDAYQQCIGRITGKGVDGMKGKDEGSGCNWASFGFFKTLGKGRIVITPDLIEHEMFDFAPAKKHK